MPANARPSAILASDLGKGEVGSSILPCSTIFPRLFAGLPSANYAWTRTVARCEVANLGQRLFTVCFRR